MKHFKLLTIVLFISSLLGCTHGVEESNNLTVGTVQKEIKNGMSGAEVASALGSPNIVSTDDLT